VQFVITPAACTVAVLSRMNNIPDPTRLRSCASWLPPLAMNAVSAVAPRVVTSSAIDLTGGPIALMLFKYAVAHLSGLLYPRRYFLANGK